MKEIVCDIWNCNGLKVIPVNIHMICGRGLAAQWKTLRPDAYNSLKRKRITSVTVVDDCVLFPVKIRWQEKANLSLIQKSMEELAKIAEENPEIPINLPQVGCGFGELDWETEVKPIAEKYWKPNMVLVIPPNNVFLKYKKTFLSSVRKDKRFQ